MTTKPPPPTDPPRIPESFLDVPAQRLYILSLGLLLQAVKVFDWFQHFLVSDDGSSISWTQKWLLLDLMYCVGLSWLRIPRLRYSFAVVMLHIFLLWFVDGVMFGGLSMNIGGAPIFVLPYWLGGSGGINGGRGRIGDIQAGNNGHLSGQHTVRMSPISTAHLNPRAHAFCYTTSPVLVPILLNNTSPQAIRYSLQPLHSDGKVEYFDIGSKELKNIEDGRKEKLQLTRAARRHSDDDDDDDEEQAAEVYEHPLVGALQRTQSVAHVRIAKPGVVKLERLIDSDNVESRIIQYASATVVPCPTAQFVEDAISKGDDKRCATNGASEDVHIDLYGVPPLSLRWYRDIHGRREHFVVDGIEGSPELERQAQTIRIPFTLETGVSLGSHIYTLESLTDGVGNSVILTEASVALRLHDHDSEPHDPKTVRALEVLRRPSISFRNCGAGNPVPLLDNAEAQLKIGLHTSDALDEPWEITVRYQPFTDDDSVPAKRFKPYKKALTTQHGKRDLIWRASAPGEYTILDVKGVHCSGDILSPDICRVEEVPRPSAEIQWQPIHECSGQTGVSASLILHGKPPFELHYLMQHDKEAPRDGKKTFRSTRGEVTLQPERSGKYRYQFTHVTDANYKLIDIVDNGISQVVHPLANADFVHSANGKKINSCSGSTVEVPVDLKGNGPWNLEVQIVEPGKSTIVTFEGLKESRETLKIAIPKAIDDRGGSFQIELVSVQDASACKNSLSVPGMSVNVRRVKPTAKFYSKDGKRQVTVLENEPTSLPLRLTGEGPWRMKYSLTGNHSELFTSTLNSPNDHITVKHSGLYEIIDVKDSQCPGSVVAGESTYQVDWVPRPSAVLSPDTIVTYEPFNSSHIRAPVCEGVDDYVDLDLSGRPPFQIMYRVARRAEAGSSVGYRDLDQPTFNSIQPRTRFQLRTAEAGRIYYEVKQIGDTAYPLANHKDHVIPRSNRLLFEQEVLKRPSAHFRNNNRLPYCLNESFSPRDVALLDGTVVLEGTAPFTLKLSIKNFAAGETHTEIVTVNSLYWKVDAPSYIFKSIGPHLVTIESVQDASHCDQFIADPASRSIWVDVAETAAIVPFERRENLCEGEVTQFQLEGTPAWAIGFEVNGKPQSTVVKTSPFAHAQKTPGTFAITSIAHQNKLCTKAITDLQFKVHPLPSAQVGHGKKIYQDIHEGDQAEIVFTLIGEPPFTFTYQRAELPTRKSGKPGKVLETHTVSGVTTNEYSIFSSAEGTWTVTFISDRYCRYPPTSD